jgi:hypothetical protein
MTNTSDESFPPSILLPAHILSGPFFYPIGNTPAVSLLSHQPPEQECINMLLLGCGDVRNILYSVMCNERGNTLDRYQPDSVSDPLKAKQLIFTCCDIEPAILGMSENIDGTNFSSKYFAFELASRRDHY